MAAAAARAVVIRRAALALPRAFSTSAAAGARPAVIGGINNPAMRSAYTDENLTQDTQATIRERLSQVPLLGQLIKKDEPAVKKPEPPPWSPKPRVNGVFHLRVKQWLSSPNITVDRYPLAKTSAPDSGGIRSSVSNYINNVRKSSASSLAQVAIRKDMPGFSPDKFEQLAAEIYHQVNSSFFNHKIAVMRQLTTEKVYSRMKRDMKTRMGSKQHPTGVHYDWSLDEFVSKPAIVQTRTFPVRGEDDVWAQITVRFHSIQSLTVTAKDGRPELVGRRLPVVEYWVFERCLKTRSAFWRVCDKLQVLNGTTGGIAAGMAAKTLLPQNKTPPPPAVAEAGAAAAEAKA